MKALRENFNGIVICLFELVIGILLLIDPIGFTSGIIITAGILLILAGLINCIKYFRANVKEASKGQFLTKGLIAVLAGAFCILNTEWFIVTFSALTVIYGVIVLLAAVEKIQLCMDFNSNEATVKRTESEESNSEEAKTDEVSAKKTGGKNEKKNS